MKTPPPELDDARRRIAAAELVGDASNHLTVDLYFNLEFSDLVAVKNLLKRFFSAQPWSEENADKLSRLLVRNVAEPVGWFEHDLGSGLALLHGFDEGTYRLWASGGSDEEASIFDRVFSGPVQPEATPNPRHVRFVIGGTPAPGVWYRRGDEVDSPGVAELLKDTDITDVLVGGDFVAIGLRRAARWKDRLDDLVVKVTELFWSAGREMRLADGPTRDQLVGGRSSGELHLLNPDDQRSRKTLLTALASEDARHRRIAVATLGLSTDRELALETLTGALTDASGLVRRTVVDVAVDLEDEAARPLLALALSDTDAWIRWKAVKGLAGLGLGQNRAAVEALSTDADFQVRFEVAAALRL